MADLLEDLENKYEKLKKELDTHRIQRDAFENEALTWADKRDVLNNNTRDAFREAKEARQMRDELNNKVKNIKNQREEWKEKAQKAYLDLKEVKNRLSNISTGGPSIAQLKRKVRDLENRQETTVLSAEKERGIVENIHALHLQIEKLKKHEEEEMKKNQDYLQKKAEYSVAKMKLEELQKQFDEIVQNSQEYHDKALELFEKAGDIKRQSDEAHQKYLQYSNKAKEEDNIVREKIEELRDFEKIITGLKQKQRTTKKQEKETELKKTAETIFEKFKKGEILTTEDILILQKAGFM